MLSLAIWWRFDGNGIPLRCKTYFHLSKVVISFIIAQSFIYTRLKICKIGGTTKHGDPD